MTTNAEWLQILEELKSVAEGAAKLTMAERGKIMAQALREIATHLGGDTTARSLLQQIYNDSLGRGAAANLAKSIFKHVSESIIRGSLMAGAGGAGGGAAGVFLGLSLGSWLLLGIGVGAVLIGGYIWSQGDKSVQVGRRGDKNARVASGDIPTRPAAVEPGSGSQQYFVYVLDLSNGSVWVGQEATLRSTPRCQFGGGGPCEGDGNNPPRVITKSRGYKTLEEAKAAWCAELKGKAIENWPLHGDRKAAVYGGKYWIGLAPGCG
ncbi:MAG TPA: hypothetical protein VF791_10605 [Pyrinomonadaceae bacterium]